MSDFLLDTKDLGTFLIRVARLTECYTAEAFAHAIDPSKNTTLVSSSAVGRWFSNESVPNTNHIGHLRSYFYKKRICWGRNHPVYEHFIGLLDRQRHDVSPSHNYIALGLDDLHTIKWTVEQAVERIFELDHSVYADLTVENEGTPEQWMPVYKEFRKVGALL